MKLSKYYTESEINKLEHYARLIKSRPSYDELKTKKLESTGYKCEICAKDLTPQQRNGKFKSIAQLHHINYDNWRYESLKDLLVLCGRCHQFIHKIHNDNLKEL